MNNSNNWGHALSISLKANWSDEDVAEKLDGVVIALDRLEPVFAPNDSESFLFGHNQFLNARPIDFLFYGRVEEVVDAILIQGELLGA